LGGNVAANYLLTTGTGSSLTSITGANVTGNVGNALNAYAVAGANVSGQVANALVAGTVTTAAQSNITSVGTLTSLTSSGNVTGANIIANTYHIRSIGTSISAAGSTQSTATVISKEINVVSTVVSGANGVVLPAVAGTVITITNTSANSLNVYPASGGIINTLAANAAFTHPAGATLQFVSPTTTQWYSVGSTYS